MVLETVMICTLDVSSGIVGVSGGMISSASLLANGTGGADEACGRCFLAKGLGDAVLEAGRTAAGY